MWTVIDIPTRTLVPTEEITYAFHTKTIKEYQCVSKSEAFEYFFFALQILILTCALVTAITGRNIPSAFNESKLLGFAAYNVFMYMIIIFILHYLTDLNMPTLEGFFELITTTIVLVLIISIKLYHAMKGHVMDMTVQTNKETSRSRKANSVHRSK
eukprot:Pgem_evm2s7476